LNCVDGHGLVLRIAEDADVGCVWVGNITRLIVHVIFLHKIVEFREGVKVRSKLIIY